MGNSMENRRDKEARRWDITSDKLRDICVALDSLQHDPNAEWRFDAMSGAFRFSDEFPETLRDDFDGLLFPCIGLLRILGAYRLSLVRGAPRDDCRDYWQAVMVAAPNWPGST